MSKRSVRVAGQRALAGAVVALCVVAQLTTAAHLVLVPHTFCAEHGVAVDAPTRAQRACDHTHDTGVDSYRGSDDEPGTDAHNHCELAVDRSGRIGLPPPPVVVVPVALFAERAREPAEVVLTPGAGVILFAPKTSPPA